MPGMLGGKKSSWIKTFIKQDSTEKRPLDHALVGKTALKRMSV